MIGLAASTRRPKSCRREPGADERGARDDTDAERAISSARLAAHALHARYDSRELTRRARAEGPGSLTYWERKVDPESELDQRERARRAVHAKKSYFAALALKSAVARRKRRE